MAVTRLFDQDYYYPPTTENLTRANRDVNALRIRPHIGRLLVTEQALEEAWRNHETYHPDGPNPYFDILMRCVALRQEAVEQRRFTLSH